MSSRSPESSAFCANASSESAFTFLDVVMLLALAGTLLILSVEKLSHRQSEPAAELASLVEFPAAATHARAFSWEPRPAIDPDRPHPALEPTPPLSRPTLSVAAKALEQLRELKTKPAASSLPARELPPLSPILNASGSPKEETARLDNLAESSNLTSLDITAPATDLARWAAHIAALPSLLDQGCGLALETPADQEAVREAEAILNRLASPSGTPPDSGALSPEWDFEILSALPADVLDQGLSLALEVLAPILRCVTLF